MHIYNDLFTITKKQQNIINSCPHRLSYHAMAPFSWINDPNGFIYYNNEYHLFFRFNPKKPVWGLIHWGHYKSTNLVQWEYMPMALYPDKEYDKDGCFSGSAIIKRDKLYLFYTGNVSDNEENIKQTQCIATSHDGINFEKYKKNPVIIHPPIDSNPTDFRDPWVWQKDDYYYMVVGSCSIKKDIGQAAFYRSKDLLEWEYINTIRDKQNNLGYMWECPSVFHLAGKDILMVSPQGIKNQGELFNNKHQSGYVFGNLDYKKGEFDFGDFCEFDRGFDFYAPQTTIDADGRMIMIAWMDMWDSEMPTKRNLWSGAMILPRELVFKDNKIYCLPIKEIESLRRNEVKFEHINIKNKTYFKSFEGSAFELVVELKIESIISDSFCLALRASEDEAEKTLLTYSKAENKLSLNRNKSGIGPKGVRNIFLDSKHTYLKLRIFVDYSSVEIFVNDGEYVMSARIYPQPESKYTFLYGDANVCKIMKWDLD